MLYNRFLSVIYFMYAAAKSLQSCPILCDPHRQQPTRLPRPWDSPGKNTGVGCHFLLQCMKVKSESEVAQSCLTLATPWTAAHQAPPSMGFSRQKYWSGVPLPSPKYSLGFRKVSSELSFTILPGELWLTTKFLAGMKHVQFLTSCVPFDNHLYAYSFFFHVFWLSAFI